MKTHFSICKAMKKDIKDQNLAVVYGGFTSEYLISVQSGKSVARWLRNAGRKVYEILLLRDGWWTVIPGADGQETRLPVDKNDFSTVIEGEKILFDKAYIAIHGDPGENGKLQAYFEMIGVPYAGCSSTCAAIAFDKYACKSYIRTSGVPLAKDMILRSTDDYDPDDLALNVGLPMFVKPCGGGSSFGVTKVKKPEDLPAAIEKGFKESDSLILEKYIVGREIDCGVYDDGDGIHALPLIEIISDNEFFDYDAKYNGASRELCPAPVPQLQKALVQDAAVKIYQRLGCTGMVRMDFILGPDDKPYFLEVNPNPGMTSASLVPQMVREAGMTMEDFMTGLMDRTDCREL